MDIPAKSETPKVDNEHNKLKNRSDISLRLPLQNSQVIKSVVLGRVFSMLDYQDSPDPNQSKCLTPLPLFRPTLRSRKTYEEKKELRSYYLPGMK